MAQLCKFFFWDGCCCPSVPCYCCWTVCVPWSSSVLCSRPVLGICILWGLVWCGLALSPGVAWLNKLSFALWNKVLMTLYFADIAWWLSHWRYCPVWVGFLYTVVDNDPSGWGMTKTSRKGSVPTACVSSTVNCIEPSIEFIWWKNSSWWHFLMTTNVSSTNLLHKAGRVGCSVEGFWLKIFHIQICNDGA